LEYLQITRGFFSVSSFGGLLPFIERKGRHRTSLTQGNGSRGRLASVSVLKQQLMEHRERGGISAVTQGPDGPLSQSRALVLSGLLVQRLQTFRATKLGQSQDRGAANIFGAFLEKKLQQGGAGLQAVGVIEVRDSLVSLHFVG